MKLRVSPTPLAAATSSRAFGRIIHLFLAVAAVVLPLKAKAQATTPASGTTITGVVKDVVTGQPIEGASVTVAGTPRGSLTNAQGRYTITGLSAGVYGVEARRLTYQMMRQNDIRATGSGTITVDFAMSQVAMQLSAVTSSATVDPTSGVKAPYAVAKLEAEAFPVPTTGAATAIANKVAGVSVIRGSGDPSDEPWVQLRSVSSPFKNNGPLWVVDGVPLNITGSSTGNQGNIGSISTRDIQSLDIANIEIIKGAAAAAQYGSAAAGGVISITTNRGKDIGLGSAQIEARTDYGYDAIPGNLPDQRKSHQFLMNSKGQWTNTAGQVVSRANRSTDPDNIQDNPFVRTYDNIGAALHANQRMINTVSLSQNSLATNLRLSYTRTDNPGIVRNAKGNLDQNVRFNVQHAFKDNLDFTLGLNHSRGTQNPSQTSFSQLFSWDPDVNLMRPDVSGAPFVINPDTGSTSTNPLYLQYIRRRQTREAGTQFNADANYRPFTWFTLAGNIGYRRRDQVLDNFTPPGFVDTDGVGLTQGTLNLRETETDVASGRLAGTVLKDIGRMTTRLTLAGESRRDKSLQFQATGDGFAITGVTDLSGATTQTNNSTITESRINSLVSSAALDYAGRYVVNANHRYEGNSLFGPEHRWNNFYGLGLSWLVSGESWYPDFLRNVNLAKIRYNYGTAGTQPDFADQYENIQVDDARFLWSSLGNRNLMPEMKYDHEVGLDFLFNNRVSLAYTFVKTKTKGAIVGVEAPAATGFNTFTANVGNTHGLTHELTVEGQVISRPNGLRWTMSANASRSVMDVDHYGRSCYKETPSLLWRCAGTPVTNYWGNVFYHSATELPTSRSATPGAWEVDNNGFLVPVGVGNHWYEGKQKALWGTTVVIDGISYRWGTPQLVWDDSTADNKYVKIGDWQPDFEYGWQNRFNRGNLNFAFTFGGQVGGQVYNSAMESLYSSLDHSDVDQRGVPDSLQKGIQYYQSSGSNGMAAGNADIWVVNSSFLKLREAVVGYTMDNKRFRFLNKAGVQRLNMQLLGQDLFRFMPGYKGLDPEGWDDYSGGINYRIDDLRYPPGRKFTGSVTVVF
jgi:TonB-linked SusC/RagA family outer membrane protein